MEMKLAAARQVLERTPLALRGLLEGLGDEWVSANEGPDTFSPRDVVGHLIHGERTDWTPRLRLILEHGERVPFVPFDRFGFRDAIRGRSTTSLLDEFAALRAENLGFVDGLKLEARELALTGKHPALGSVTLQQLLATWVVHDLGHLAQIARVMAKQYRAEVGPWTEYLTILSK